MPRNWRLAWRTWRLLVLIALLDGHGIPGTVLTAPATCQYLAEGAARPPDPQRAWSALGVLERAGLVTVDAASTPPAVWVSPVLQAAVRASAPAGPAGPGRPRGGRRAGAGVAGRSAPVRAGRAAAVMRRQPAPSRRGWAVAGGGIPRLLLAAGQSLDAAGLTGPGGHLVAGAGRRQ